MQLRAAATARTAASAGHSQRARRRAAAWRVAGSDDRRSRTVAQVRWMALGLCVRPGEVARPAGVGCPNVDSSGKLLMRRSLLVCLAGQVSLACGPRSGADELLDDSESRVCR